MKKILLDTNFLLIPEQFKVDIFTEIDRICHFNYQLCIVDKTITELESIIKNIKSKDKNAAKIALKLINAKNIHQIPSESLKNKTTDDIIFETASPNYIIATQDKELKKRLRQKKIPIISLRKKKYLKYFE